VSFNQRLQEVCKGALKMWGPKAALNAPKPDEAPSGVRGNEMRR